MPLVRIQVWPPFSVLKITLRGNKMQDVTLAKANKLRNLLKDKVLPQLHLQIMVNRTVKFLGHESEQDISNIFSNAVKEFSDAVSQRDLVQTTILKLRKTISAVNDRYMLPDLMADINFYMGEVIFWKSLVGAPNESKSPSEIKAILDFEAKNLVASTATYGRSSGTSKTFVVADANYTAKAVSERISTLEATVRSLEEQRNTKNYQVMVSLDDEIVKVLETFKLL
jgi:hypothetical protein